MYSVLDIMNSLAATCWIAYSHEDRVVLFTFTSVEGAENTYISRHSDFYHFTADAESAWLSPSWRPSPSWRSVLGKTKNPTSKQVRRVNGFSHHSLCFGMDDASSKNLLLSTCDCRILSRRQPPTCDCRLNIFRSITTNYFADLSTF